MHDPKTRGCVNAPKQIDSVVRQKNNFNMQNIKLNRNSSCFEFYYMNWQKKIRDKWHILGRPYTIIKQFAPILCT